VATYSTLAGIVSILGLYINGHISIYAISLVFIISYFIVNFFVQIHADTGDAILIAYLQNEELACRDLLKADTKKSRADFSREHIKSVRHSKTKDIVK